jgi:hypothetical protein
MLIEEVFVNEKSQEVTVTAIIDDAVLIYNQTLLDPPEYGPGLCITSFPLEQIDFNLDDKDALEDFLLDADWEVLRHKDYDYDYD